MSLNGRYLRVDLSTGSIKVIEWDVKRVKDVVGPLYLAAEIMLREVERGVDPFSPENKFIWAIGTLVGTPAPAANKSIVIAKSPLTGAWGDAISAARAGVQLKRTGYDMLVVDGVAKEPVYIYIEDDKVEIRDASKYWGKTTFETFEGLKKEVGEEFNVIAIGPAGEKLVRLANVLGDDYRAFGRCGIGAVMGSKKLKAVVVKGTKEVPVAREDKFRELSKKIYEIVTTSPARKRFYDFGTAGAVVPFNEMSNLPIRNWTRGYFPGAEKISGEKMVETILVDRKACWMCPICCGRVVEVKTGPYATPRTAGPEYETLAALGSLCYVDNLEAVAKANYICNSYGVDTISTGAVIAFAMELYERGILTKEDTGGIELKFGSADAMVKMVELICRREGLGDLLAEGVKRAAEKIGRGAEKYAIHVKGLELPMHSPYRFKCMGLQYATSNRGACHNRGSPAYVARGILHPELGLSEKLDGFTEKGWGKVTKIHQDACTLVDALGFCKFAVFHCGTPFTLLAELFSAATGVDVTLQDLMKGAERIWILERSFNVKMGLTSRDDTLPVRFIKEPPPDGAAKGQTVNLEVMLREYYEERGLDELGRPKVEKLKELELDFVIPIIYK